MRGCHLKSGGLHHLGVQYNILTLAKMEVWTPGGFDYASPPRFPAKTELLTKFLSKLYDTYIVYSVHFSWQLPAVQKKAAIVYC